MKLRIMPLILLNVLLLNSWGCSVQNQPDSTVENAIQATQRTVSDNFKKHYAGAKKWGALIKRGIALKDQGKYQEALIPLEEAYENAAFGKIEKEITLDLMAQTYELMGDYELAANFYDGAAQTAMHPVNTDKHQAKADELRAKFTPQ